MMPIDLAILEKTTFMWGYPKTLSMFNSLFGTIINTDSVNTRIDLLLKKDEI